MPIYFLDRPPFENPGYAPAYWGLSSFPWTKLEKCVGNMVQSFSVKNSAFIFGGLAKVILGEKKWTQFVQMTHFIRKWYKNIHQLHKRVLGEISCFYIFRIENCVIENYYMKYFEKYAFLRSKHVFLVLFCNLLLIFSRFCARCWCFLAISCSFSLIFAYINTPQLATATRIARIARKQCTFSCIRLLANFLPMSKCFYLNKN